MLLFSVFLELVVTACGDKNNESETQAAAKSDVVAPPKRNDAVLPPTPALASDEVAISRAELRGLCLVPTLPMVDSDSAIHITSLTIAGAEADVLPIPWVIIDTQVGPALPSSWSAQDYLSRVGRAFHTSVGPCRQVSDGSPPTLVTALFKESRSKGQKGYWAYVGFIHDPMTGINGKDEVNAAIEFLGVSEREALEAIQMRLQKVAKAELGAVLKKHKHTSASTPWTEHL